MSSRVMFITPVTWMGSADTGCVIVRQQMPAHVTKVEERTIGAPFGLPRIRFPGDGAIDVPSTPLKPGSQLRGASRGTTSALHAITTLLGTKWVIDDWCAP
jgi:hypothetical protein